MTTGWQGDSVPDVSVIIISWNARKYLEECLGTLATAVSRSCEILVVDNDSSDGSPQMVAERFPNVTLIQTGGNLGFAKANNLGITRSRGRYLALVNSDVHLFPGCLDQLLAYLDERPDVGMVGPRILYGDRRLQISCRRFPTLWNTTCQSLYFNKLFPRSSFFSGEQMNHFLHDRECAVEALSGCFIVARRKAVEQFGLLDETFWMYGEDVDWCWRCGRAGWKVMFYPRAESIHYGGGSSANDPARFAVAQLNARRQLWAKHCSRPVQVGLLCVVVVQTVLRLLAATVGSLFVVSGREAHAERRKTQAACLRFLLKPK